jgi:hypothetical protein
MRSGNRGVWNARIGLFAATIRRKSEYEGCFSVSWTSIEQDLMKPIFLALIAISFLASCSGGLRIEKRQYRDGFYIGKSNQRTESKAVQPETEAADLNNAVEVQHRESTEEVVVGDSTAVNARTVEDKSKNILARIDSVKQNIRVKADSVRNEIEQTEAAPPIYNGPADAKNLVLLQRIAWILFLAGILVIGAGIIVTIYFWSFPAFIVVGPIAILVSYGISLAVMILAMERFKKYAAKDPETAHFYRKMRNRSLIIVGIVSLLLLFTFFLWLVSITGFGF